MNIELVLTVLNFKTFLAGERDLALHPLISSIRLTLMIQIRDR